jgi:hypothetical protein
MMAFSDGWLIFPSHTNHTPCIKNCKKNYQKTAGDKPLTSEGKTIACFRQRKASKGAKYQENPS